MPKTNIFVSYTHADDTHRREFMKTLGFLEEQYNFELWYDGKLNVGDPLFSDIDKALSNSDIVCLLISSAYLGSPACQKEKNDALKLHQEKGISVFPIIVSSCLWTEDHKLANLLAAPHDGKPVDSFPDLNNVWTQVGKQLLKTITKVQEIQNILPSDMYLEFLNDADIFTKAHSQKDSVFLDDIFVYPNLQIIDNDTKYRKSMNSKGLIDKITDEKRTLIIGNDQSGKTTLCKQFCQEYLKKGFFPIYLSEKRNDYTGNFKKNIFKSFSSFYGEKELSTVPNQRIALILDDFHIAKNKDKIIDILPEYEHIIVIADDIYSLDIKNETFVKDFNRYDIEEFTPSLRNELIKKWTALTDKNDTSCAIENDDYKQLDTMTCMVNELLGKVFSKGIMPAFPFFILNVISTQEALNRPLDQEITSQGHCYQSLIYIFLRKYGVKNDEVDTYLNFLTEFAFYLYTSSIREATEEQFEAFMAEYVTKYNLAINQDIMIRALRATNIITINSFLSYSFKYPYLYYFFVARKLAEYRDEHKKYIEHIVANLQKNENAYIAIFISHHSKNDFVFDEIILNAECMFDSYKVATLTKQEMGFFDKERDNIAIAFREVMTGTPANNRQKALELEDKAEQEQQEVHDDDDVKSQTADEDDSERLYRELRRSIKTVEVMGSIIKNRAGSLEKNRLESIFETGVEVHLRIMSSFFKIIQDEATQEHIIDYIKQRIESKTALQPESREINPRKLEKAAKEIFWNLNYSVILALTNKIVISLGSDKLKDIIINVCSKKKSPAYSVIKHCILMQYNKQLNENEIKEELKNKEFSEISKDLLRSFIARFCSMHKIKHDKRQIIMNMLDIPSSRLFAKKEREG